MGRSTDIGNKKERVLIRNIGRLVNITDAGRISGTMMNRMHCISDAALIVENDRISAFGKESEIIASLADTSYDSPPLFDEVIDAGGGMVLPAFCDSHTHLLYPASREQEMADRLRGLSYAEITAHGGGILNSARKMEQLSDEELLQGAFERLNNIMATGTGTVEIKSGYGLSFKQELRMLRLIRRLADEVPITVCPTFLGAHAIPEDFRKNPDTYVDLVVEEMLPAVVAENLASFVDVFCENGFFTSRQTERILEAAAGLGMKPRIHTNQFSHSGGIESAIRYHALSVDHLEELNAAEISLLAESDVIPSLLPGCSFFMNLPYPPARRMLDAGLPVALASDYNPGTNPSGDMKFVLSLACLKMNMTVSEALTAATLNGASSLALGDSRGSIAVGKRADLILTRALPSLEYIPYAYTEKLVERMVIAGKQIPLPVNMPD